MLEYALSKKGLLLAGLLLVSAVSGVKLLDSKAPVEVAESRPRPILKPAPRPSRELWAASDAIKLPSSSAPPPVELDPFPYIEEPDTAGLVERSCGPESEWAEFHVRTDADVLALRRLKRGDRVKIYVHWRAQPYGSIKVKNAACVRLLGVTNTDGVKPLVAKIKTGPPKGPLRQGGFIIENFRIAPGEVFEATQAAHGGDCVSLQGVYQFFVLRNNDISGCGHHALLASASQLHLELDGNNFEQASSHLVYINRAAMAYVHDNSFQSPGWGHALRCIAHRCVIRNNRISNVQLDGSVLPRGGTNPFSRGRTYIGMAPLEVYTCGNGHIVENNEIKFYGYEKNYDFAAIFRWREAIYSCNLWGHDDKRWIPMEYGSTRWENPASWDGIQDVDLLVQNNVTHCLNEPCHGWDVRSTYPVMGNDEKKALRKHLKSSDYFRWKSVLADRSHPNLPWVARRIPDKRHSEFLRGEFVGKMFLPAPAWWKERGLVTFRGNRTQNPLPDYVRPQSPPRFMCFKEVNDEGDCPPFFPRARIVMAP